MLKDLFLVGAGSFFGGMARYLVSYCMKGVGSGFPWATFTVNVVAACLLACYGLSSPAAMPLL